MSDMRIDYEEMAIDFLAYLDRERAKVWDEAVYAAHDELRVTGDPDADPINPYGKK